MLKCWLSSKRTKMTKKLLTFILFFLCFQANATEFIVNNLNEFEQALSKSKAGDVIVWKDGNYEDMKISFKGNGTAEKPIVLKAQTAYNTIVNSVGAAIKIGVGNKNKVKPLVAPKNVLLVGNIVINTVGKYIEPIVIENPTSNYTLTDNLYTNGETSEKGFLQIKTKELVLKDGFYFGKQLANKSVINTINQRLAIHQINLSAKEIMEFDVSKVVTKKDVGVTWLKK